MRRLLISGDTHGDMSYLHTLCKLANRHSCDAILVCGDWGYVWPGRENRLEAASNVLMQFNQRMFFLDGNHEWFEELIRLGASPDADRFVDLTDNITYLPRGFTWEWCGVKMMSMGGAVSVDKARRTPYISWWPEETIKPADVERARSKGPVDILFSHDTVDIPEALHTHLTTHFGFVPYKMEAESQANRRAMDEVWNSARPKVMFHGHYHYSYTEQIEDTSMIGLNCNGNHGSWAILDLEEWAEANL